MVTQIVINGQSRESRLDDVLRHILQNTGTQDGRKRKEKLSDKTVWLVSKPGSGKNI
jgi:hypothetical protein